MTDAPPQSPDSTRILVIGCGGIGGVVSARLADAGFDVTAITNNVGIAEAIAADGLQARWDGEEHRVSITARPDASVPDGEARFDVALLAVPPDAAELAAEAALPLITDDAPIVCFPNGLIEERLARTIDVRRLVGGIVRFGASMSGPGRVEQTAAGGFTLGVLPGGDESHAERVAGILEHVGPVQRSDNLRGARWSKLAINCAISSMSAVSGETLGTNVSRRFVRRLVLETMTEVVVAARAEGVELEKLAGALDLNWLALTEREQRQTGTPSLIAKHTALLAVGFKYRNMRSSMLRAIERGRTPSVDFLNGEITERAATFGFPAPVNQALQDAVHEIAAGDRTSSMESLRAVYLDTRGSGDSSAPPHRTNSSGDGVRAG